MIDPARITRGLTLRGFDVAVVYAPITGSTNDDAKRAASSGLTPPAVFIADEQTAGRGRGGNSWVAPSGDGLLLSLLLSPRLAPSDAARITLAVGVALSELVAQLAPERVRIKWPNDLLLDGKKLAGILVEAQTRGEGLSSLVIGVGLNVSTVTFPEALDHHATSLVASGLVEPERNDLIVEVTAALLEAALRFEHEGLAPFLEILRERDALLGEEVTVDGVNGVGTGIDDQGQLLVGISSSEVRAVASGHVEWRGRLP